MLYSFWLRRRAGKAFHITDVTLPYHRGLPVVIRIEVADENQ